MGRVAFIAVVIGFSLASAAQQPQPPNTRQAGLALLAQARSVAGSANPRFRADVLDDIAVAAYETGEEAASADILKEALADFHQQLAERRGVPRQLTGSHSGMPSGLADCGITTWMAAERHLAAHDRTGARAWVAAALEVFPNLNDDFERRMLGMHLYKLQVALDDLDGARHTVAAMRPPDHPDSTALGDIAAQMARDGDVAGARALAKGLPDFAMAEILGKVAVTQAETKDFVGALETVKGIQQPYRRADVVAEIGEQEAKSGDNAGALATFSAALQLQPKGAEPSRRIVLAEARGGLFENAMHLLASAAAAGAGRPASDEYVDVGLIAAAAKKPDIARQCFAAASTLIQNQPEPDQPNHDSLGRPIDDKQLQLQRVVAAEAQAGDLPDAIQTDDLLTGQYRQFGLKAIAAAQANAGDVQAADQTLAQDPTNRGGGSDVIEAKARAGDLVSAFHAARPYGGYELEKVFRAYCKPQTMKTCFEAASALTFPERRASALLGMAESLLGIGSTPAPGFSSPFHYSVPR